MTDLYPWQQPQWQQLVSQYRQQRLPHALLFTGPTGLGKRTFAQHFARYLLCREAQESACGQCPGCRLTLVNNHPDLLSIAPEEAGKNIKVDQIREMIPVLSQTAQRAGYQIAIISPAEALNRAAANALLKTLEEPAGRVLLILVSHQPGALPATITSRCQRIAFTAGFGAESWLQQQLQAHNFTAEANLLLKIAEYAPLRALDLAQGQYLALRDQLLGHLLAVAQKKTTLLAPVSDFLKQDLKLWLDAFISLILDLARLHIGLETPALTNHDRFDLLQSLIRIYPLSNLWPFLTKLHQARCWLVNTQIHLNEQLLLESLLIDWESGISIR
jgi:DNA polymerase III subunit delta'